MRAVSSKSVKPLDALLLASGAGLMFAGLARIEDPRAVPVRSPAALLSVSGAALLLYGSWRISPNLGAAAATLMVVGGAVNEHRKNLGLPEIPLPGFTLRGAQEPR